MRLTCPCCGAAYSLEVLLADAAARQAVVAALGLPAGLGERLLRYLALFRPRERALSWERAARLLDELNAAVAAGQIERNGQIWAAPLDYWKTAIDQMLDGRDRLSLPLKSHGYLYEIIVGMNQRASEQRAARQEVADEQARARAGERSGRMQRAGESVGQMQRAAGTGTAPDALPERAPRIPPPADFRALLTRLTGQPAAPEAPDAATDLPA